MVELNKMASDDLITIILVAINAYLKENNEPFSVDKNVLAAVYDEAIAGQKYPVMALRHTDDNRLQIVVDMENTEEHE